MASDPSPAMYRFTVSTSSLVKELCVDFVPQAFELINPLLLEPSELAAHSDPSSLHILSGFAAITQPPPGKSGESHFGGMFPAIFTGPEKQAATPIAPVMVGVTKRRKKFDGAQVPYFPPALFGPQSGPGMKAFFSTGKTLGKQHGSFPQVV